MAAVIARHHHERYDGRGYPDQLSGKDIPLAARIAAIADVYDALTTRRVYKPAFSHDKAMTIILEGSGSAFDPEIVEAFVQCEKDFNDLAHALADEMENQEEEKPQLALSVN
jgi:putative two-component system response regulator